MRLKERLHRFEHWVFRYRIFLLSLVLMGVLINLLYRGKNFDIAIPLLIVGPLFKWIDHRGQKRKRSADQAREDSLFDQSLTQDAAAIRTGGVPGAPVSLEDFFGAGGGKKEDAPK